MEKDTIKIMIFELDGEQYGINVQEVSSIEQFQEITRIPRTSDYVKGVINLRGIVTPIIDLKERMEISSQDEDDFRDKKLLIIQNQNEYIGYIIDHASDVIDIEIEKIQPTPEIIGRINGDFLEGVIKINERLIILINVNSLLPANYDKTLINTI